MKRLGTTVITVLLGIMLAGGHLALVQTIAWASMIAVRTASDSFTVAVETTFDGKHPCSTCTAIVKHAADGHGKGVPPPTVKKLKIDHVVPLPCLEPAGRATAKLLSGHAPLTIGRPADAPPTRPPARS